MSRSAVLLACLLALHPISGQTLGTGNSLGPELMFLSQIDNGPLDVVDKFVGIGAGTGRLRTSTDGTLSGNPFGIVAGFTAAGADPRTSLGPEVGVVGIPLDSFDILWNTFESPGLPMLGSTPLELVYPVECTAVTPGVDDGCYLQAFCADVSKAHGLALSMALEIDLLLVAITSAGPYGPNNFLSYEPKCFEPIFYGVAYDRLYVNANGSVTFTGGDIDFTPTTSEFASGRPRAAPCWTNLAPNIGGDIWIVESFGRISVVWDDVLALPGNQNRSSFHVDFLSDGRIEMGWSELRPVNTDDLIGITPGGGAAGISRDLSQLGLFVGQPMESIFQFSTESGCLDTIRDLAGGGATFYPGTDGSYTFETSEFPPQISSVTPSQGSFQGGTSVTVTGLNLDAGRSYGVRFGAGGTVPATVTGPCSLTCVTPPGSVGFVTVELSASGVAMATLPNGYNYRP